VSELPNGWTHATLDAIADVLDFEREPINSSEREGRISGKSAADLYPYYGATGQVGFIDSFRSEGQRVLLGEDAAPFLDPVKDKAYLASGRFWVNNHAHVLAGAAGLIDNRFLCHQLNTVDYHPFVTGSTRLKLTSSAMKQIPMVVAPAAEQTRIVEKLEELLSDLDAGVAELNAAQKKLVQYRQSLLKAAVEGALTAEWRAARSAPLPPRGGGAGGEGATRSRHEPELISCATHPHAEFTHHGQALPTSPPLPNPSPARGEGLEYETGAQLLQRILTERRVRWEAKQLAKFAEQGKTPPKDWQKKYPEPVQPDTTNLPQLPEGWVWASLDQLTEFITSGSRGWADYYADAGARFIRSQNINKDWLDLSDVAFVSPPAGSEGARTRVQRDDLLLTITGANVGKAASVETELDEAYVSQHVALIRVIETCLTAFLHLFLTADAGGRGQLNKQAYGAGKPGLNLQQVAAVLVPLAGSSEIHVLLGTVTAQFEAATANETAITVALKQSTAQRQNILRAAFSGQLVPQDPNDEPASVLLARIRTERAARDAVKKPRGRKPRESV